MDLSYKRYETSVLVTGIETIMFGVFLEIWHTPMPIIRTDVFSESFKHLADIPMILIIVAIGILALVVSIPSNRSEYKIQLVSLILMQLVWSYSVAGFVISFYDSMNNPNVIHLTPWVLFLSVSVFIRNCDNIYTLIVLRKTRQEQLNQLEELKYLESKIAVTRQTTTQQLAKIEKAHANSKEGKVYSTSGNKNT